MDNRLDLNFKETFKCPRCGQLITLDADESNCPKCKGFITSVEKERFIKIQNYVENQFERDETQGYFYLSVFWIGLILLSLFAVLFFEYKLNLTKFINEGLKSGGIWWIVGVMSLGIIPLLIGFWRKNKDKE